MPVEGRLIDGAPPKSAVTEDLEILFELSHLVFFRDTPSANLLATIAAAAVAASAAPCRATCAEPPTTTCTKGRLTAAPSPVFDTSCTRRPAGRVRSLS
eukprot:CAMPEP_0179417842 /NCGR_PEP_ID=MMETSP0799-20121207/7596_1 /TAXON_ID=46947 /ORGANISM="Geminigera cryophila, Strain CCMP2564" /LENGTH=98 /DNA_ID=CAMNT_0021190905 /DNA_START=84 /DNA_END=380 /DNA_ORIENTATION=-